MKRFAPIGIVVAVTVVFEVGLHVLDGKAVEWWSDLGIAAAAVAAALAMAKRASATVGVFRRAWAWTSASCALWAVGQLTWSWYQLSGASALPFPSVADIAWVVSLPVGAAAVIGLPHAGLSRTRCVLDSLVAAGSTTVAVWSVLLALSPHALDGAPLAFALAVFYPVVNLAVAALVTIFATRWQGPEAGTLLGLAGAWSALGITCTAYGWLLLEGSYVTGHWIDAGYVLAFALFTAVAVRPQRDEPSRVERDDHSRIGVALPYAPLVIALGALGTGRVQFDLVLTLAVVLTGAVVVVRQYLTLVENQALTRDLERRVVERTAELAASEARYRGALAGGGVGSFEIDLLSQRVFWSKEAQAIHDVAPGAFVGTFDAAMAAVHRDDHVRVNAAVAEMNDRGETTLQYRVARTDGEERWVEVRASISHDADRELVVGVVSDITAQKAAEAELDRLAHTDTLTGLPNRARLLATLDAALDAGEPVTLLVMDLDGFKEINDGLGHETGDRFLVEVAARLRAGVRPGDLVARLGGDEFAVALLGTGGIDVGSTVADNLLAALSQPVEVAGLRLPAAASIGIAFAPDHGTNPSDLLRHADVAMYRAKQRGGSWASFTATADGDRSSRLAMLADLRAAIDDDAIDVQYQPQLDLVTGRVVAVEALARWTHPTSGPVSPAEFIPLAEHSGLIRDLTPIVLRHALAQCARWRAEGLDLKVAVNLSPRLFGDPDLVSFIDRALVEARVAPSALVIEITEGAFADETPAVERTVSGLRGLGVRLSVDDFGTGYSSLGYLRRLPVDEVKIDRAFISGLPSHVDSGIVRAVLELARHLGLAVVAEGVEDQATLDLLREWGCAMAQGYLVARPQAAVDLTAWLIDRSGSSNDITGLDAVDT